MRVSKPAQARHDAATLPRIRDLEADGLSLRQIADQLQQDGIPSPGGVGKWSHIAVKRILERAEQDPPATPGPIVNVKGGGNMTGTVTITVSGVKTVSVAPVNITTADSQSRPLPKESLIKRPESYTLLDDLRAAREGGYNLTEALNAAAGRPLAFSFRRGGR